MPSRNFKSIAYTGATVKGPFGKLIIDLAGLDTAGHVHPILREHAREKVVGMSNITERKGGGLLMKGKMLATADAREVIGLADEGFPWQASVGIGIDDVEEVPAGKAVSVNGATFSGPGVVIRRAKLKETSVCVLGADDATSFVVE